MRNKLIHSFLQDPEQKKIYETYLQNPNEINKELVESKFKLHVMKLKVLAYFSKVLFYEAQRFDKKIRRTTVPLLDNDTEESPIIIDTALEISDEPILESHFENERLFSLISKLDENNKQLLYLLYVQNLDEGEVAAKFGVTKQAINKRKNNLLKKFRKLYFK